MRKSTFVALAMGSLVAAPVTFAQQKHAVAGTWMLVSNTGTGADGSKNTPFGPEPKGLLVFTEDGHYSLHICRNNRTPYAGKTRMEGTADEYRATVQGCNPHWGRYTVSGGNIVFQVDDAMYPNWNGLKQERPFTVKDNELRYHVPAASGGGSSEVVWRRVKG